MSGNHSTRESLVGKQFYRWKVLPDCPPENRQGSVYAECQCGNVRLISASRLISGKSRSCGCSRKSNARHGMEGTREYRSWLGLKGRCNNPNDQKFSRYGGRGIRVCERWQNSFENFYADMGPCPVGLTIDRKNNDGNYEPSNCRWATGVQQARNNSKNRILTLNGESKTVKEWSEIIGCSEFTLHTRRRAGWTDDAILTRPVDRAHAQPRPSYKRAASATTTTSSR